MNQFNHKFLNTKTLHYTAWALLTIVIAITGYFIVVNTVLANQPLPTFSIAGIQVSESTKDEIIPILENQVKENWPNPFILRIEDNQYTFNTKEIPITIDQDYLKDYGKGADLAKVISEGLHSVIGSDPVKIAYKIDTNFILASTGLSLSQDETIAAHVNESDVLVNCHTNVFKLKVNSRNIDARFQKALESGETKIGMSWLELTNDAYLLDLCKTYNLTFAQIQNGVGSLVGQDLSQIFIATVTSNQISWRVSSQHALEGLLKQAQKQFSVPKLEGEYTIIGNKIALLSPYQTGKVLDIEESIIQINNWLQSQSPNTNFPLVYQIDTPKISNLGMPIEDFTQQLGEGKTRIDLIRNGQPNGVVTYAQHGVEAMNNLIIYPGREFSYIDTINPQPGGWMANGRPIGSGICNSTTTLFRAALESGLKITDRSYHPTYVKSYEWGYPENLVDAVYFTEPRVDLKFKNDTNYPILLRSKVTQKGDGWQYHTITVSTNAAAPSREVKIDQFKKKNVISETKFEGSFRRRVWEGGELIINERFKSIYR